ncbi:MAG: 3-phosphoshikimate 1-carboxyvinyltransferase, partial [Propionibacteriaceae bacterium]|nr:3-phosphoshikimate 1-carboxyvinyltransferase [Propionibacteriaceae bacterium]
LVAGGEVVADWPAQSVQPGPELLDALAAFGADIEVRPGRVVARGDGAIAGADLDLGRISEFAPVAAALAALADSPSRLRGVAHIRGHETDRLAALEAGVNALGGVAAQTADGLRITPRPLQGGLWHACGDHRMAHAAALLGLRVPGIEVDDIGVTAKTIADFPDRWASLVSQGAAGG